MPGLVVTDPIKFEKAIHSTRILPGDTIWLKPGTYSPYYGAGKGVFNFQINGTLANPIVIRPVTPGTVTIAGGIQILQGSASYITLMDLEISPIPTTRSILRADVDWPNAVYITGAGCSLIGCHVHNGAQGLALFGAGTATIVENIISDNGWTEAAFGGGDHGANIYTHNQPGGAISIARNAFMWNFGAISVDHWSASSNNVQDYDTQYNTFVGQGVLFASVSGIVQNNLFHHNHMYGSYIEFGEADQPNNLSVNAHDNRIYSIYTTIQVRFFRQLNFQSNFLYKDTIADGYGIYDRNSLAMTNVINNNAYYAISGTEGFYDRDNATLLTNAQWQALGYDAASTFTVGSPVANEIFVIKYSLSARWLGQVVIWNWENLNSVSVDLTALGLANGNYYLVNAQDPKTDKVLFAYTGANIIVNMLASAHTVESPTGGNAPAKTFPRFGCFIISLS